ncbi:T4 family baseplate hub assembly chaperone [Streptomyces jumonjinensis]|uniref:Phage baseplate protein n=1 Tax=Streptomyces jumonjinensis TaxID=1945 RepID=A0A646KGE7_STRJU|nr:hypothetical protein [Streptomyces jumonjinensis]MQT01325.1 hypothetical protein [Streptomyces jumonjinensis]
MTPTGPAELLAAWEDGLARQEAERSWLLHRAARPGAADAELLSLPAGARETDLLALRRSLFGERMQVRVECGACGEAMEFDLDTTLLGAAAHAPKGPLRVTEGEWTVEFRLPTVADVTAAAASPDPAAARRLLLRRCTLSAVRDGAAVPPERLAALPLPEEMERRLAEAAEEADPAAGTTLNVACPACGGTTAAELDIASCLWAEVDHWARDLLLDVHLLATAYGWSEPEILALSPLRRRYYLELCADA